MPPKVRLTKDMLTDAAIELVRREGIDALGVRSLASFVGCSTQPVLSNFGTAELLKQSTLGTVYELYEAKTTEMMKAGRYPAYKASGMAYIDFARTEPRLFEALFMQKRDAKIAAAEDFIDEAILPIVMKNLGISEARARLLHLEMWSFVHGIAVMCATSYLTFTEEEISEMLTDVYLGVGKYQKEKEK